MARKHPDVDPKQFPLISNLDKFSFAIIMHETTEMDGVIVEILEPQSTEPKIPIPQTSASIQPNQRDLMEAGPSNRITPPPRATTPMGSDTSPSLSTTDFWKGLEIDPSDTEVNKTRVDTPVFSDFLMEAMRIAEIPDTDWEELDKWAEEL
jgi:hypothetical protein